ncbi:MAG: hypothetical protein AAGE43_00480 [Pseudomonadota bacterium]
MRFLIGIVTGGLLTLFIATAMDAPTRPILTDAQERLSQLWDGLIDQTSHTLFEDVPVTGPKTTLNQDDATEGPAPKPTAEARGPQSAAAPTGETAIWRDEEPAEPAATLNPVTALTAPEAPAPSAQPADDLAKTGAADMLADAVLRTPAAESAALDSAPLETPALDQAALEPGSWTLAQQTGAITAVWVPFHSQMSAEGFAARLGRELDHEFRVEKRGAGSYEVVFDAVDPIQQALLEARVREITGQ